VCVCVCVCVCVIVSATVSRIAHDDGEMHCSTKAAVWTGAFIQSASELKPRKERFRK